MVDFTAPSFSLGFDSDSDTDPQLNPTIETLSNRPPSSSIDANARPEPSIDASSLTFEEDFKNFELKPIGGDAQVEDRPRILKRLRRGVSSVAKRRKTGKVCLNVDDDDDDDDEIEEFSPQKDLSRDKHSSGKNLSASASSSSKFSLRSHGALTPRCVSRTQAQTTTPVSNVSTSTSMEARSSESKFQELNNSPIRRFQLIDSDTDDSPSQPHGPNRPNLKTGDQNRIAKTSLNARKIDDLWEDFCLKKCTNVPTPVLDEICEEYFSSLKETNVSHSQENGLHLNRSKHCNSGNGKSKNVELYENPPGPLPPAYSYFHNSDPRIQQLVRQRLVHFSPLGDLNNIEIRQPSTEDIDYMYQFGQREGPGTSNQDLEGSCKKGRKSMKQSSAKGRSQNSGNWVNPKSNAKVPTDAGKRRICANSGAAGVWHTGRDGRKVYIAKNGQELKGQIAYRQYKKESGPGFKRSKRKATSKKKTTLKKKAKR